MIKTTIKVIGFIRVDDHIWVDTSYTINNVGFFITTYDSFTNIKVFLAESSISIYYTHSMSKKH